MITFFNKLKIIPFFLPYRIDSRMTHLYLYMSFAGYVNLILKRKLDKKYTLIALIFILSLLRSIFFKDFYSLQRSIIILGSILFIPFLEQNYTKFEFEKFVRSTSVVCLLFFGYEVLVGGLTQKAIMGTNLTLPRLNGILSFSNHTGILLAILGLLTFRLKSYLLTFLNFIGILLTVSRTGLMVFICGVSLLLILRYLSNLRKIFLFLLLGISVGSPLILCTIEKLAPDNLKGQLNSLFSGRYARQIMFINMIADHPLGVGTGNVQNYYKDYVSKGSTIVTNGIYVIPPDIENDVPHNAFIRLINEQGIQGYLLFVLFILFVFRLRKNTEPTDWHIILSAFLLSGIMMDFMNDFSFYLATASVGIMTRKEN